MERLVTSVDPDNRRRAGRERLGIAAAALLAACLTVPAGPAWTQEPAEEQEQLGDRETRETAAMREFVYKDLGQAQEAADEKQWAEAIRLLDRLAKKELNSYEKIQSLNLYAFIYYSQDQYPKAIKAFEDILKEDAVTPSIEAITIYSLSQLHFAAENWKKAAELLEAWLELPSTQPKAQHHELLGQAYYQLKDYRKVIPHIRSAIELTRQSGQPVKEQSYLLLRVSYYELGMHSQVIAMLEELIQRYPGEKYWLQLAGVYGEMGNEQMQMTTMELAHLQGFLDKESEIRNLAGLLINNGLPYKAGKILQKAIDDGAVEPTLSNWRFLSQAWMMAREDAKSIPALSRAAELSRDGELDVLLAQSHMNLEQWDQAIAAARTGIRKGGLGRADEAYVLLGQALFNKGDYSEARAAFEKAQADRRSRRLASQWLRYIDSEAERQEQLRAALEQ